jgi:RNA-directed DNA polymerase
MVRTYPDIPFERYADDIICHCPGVEEAQALWDALEVWFAACRLVLHPQKTRLVYGKDTNRRGDFPNQSFDFLGYTFRPRKAVWRGGRYGVSFLPAASPKALEAIRQAIRGWTMHRRSDKTLDDVARMYRGTLRGIGLKVAKTTPKTFESRVQGLVADHPTLLSVSDAPDDCQSAHPEPHSANRSPPRDPS